MGSQDGLHCEPNFLSLRSGERIPRKPSSRLAALNLVAAEVLRRKELSPKGIRLVTSAATSRRFMGRVRERGSKYEIVFRQCFQGFPLSPALSPLVPPGEREKTKRPLLPLPLSPILRTPLYVRLCSLMFAYVRLMGGKCSRRRIVNAVQSCKMHDKPR